ncbi:hypothetical protein crov298 [Cafeteria roenbergensis virus]|uniref:Uncharacterized protein n=1 Tax=Cafeteria roenbergensis virus (strain BV-PW1) TaxID=693272 RepID=E3T568_CROVB|nr:hypothetical protein crov298 [Cafeteria roenbergensis virus BV-PW1]ADO67331.1 hypothetical protein crov298 [Cafeteria roenbergensis virus BV-PW1]
MSLESTYKNIVSNPFFGNIKVNPSKNNLEDIEDITQNNFYKYFKNIYVVSPLKTPKLSWFKPTMTQEDLTDMLNNCIILKKKKSLGKISIFFEWMKTVSTDIITHCKTGSLQFNKDEETDKEILILPIFLLSFDQINTFMEMYNDKDWFENFLINFKLSDNFKISQNFFEFKHALDTSPPTYWCKDNNTNINVTNTFLKRNFKWNIFKSNKDPSKIKTITEMKKYNINEDNYISMFFKTRGNFDDKFGKINFKLYHLPKINNLLNQEQFNQLLTDITPKNRFQLFFNILASPEYCHLIINNGQVWDLMDDVVSRCKPLVRYVMFYSYLSLYLQENIKKTFLNKNDTCILKLSNVCKLPTFPYLQSDPNSHPAIAAAHLINQKVIPLDNFYGIPCFVENSECAKNQNSISDVPTFKKKLNIFLTGNSTTNILCKMNWENIHLTGSVLSACVPEKPHLVNIVQHVPENVRNKEDYIYHRYFSEYYVKSDVDVLINISNPLELYLRTLKFKKDLENGMNHYNKINETHLEICRKGFFKFNYSFLINKLIPYWNKKGTILNTKDIISNLTNIETYKYFIPFYEEARVVFYTKFIEKTNLTWEECIKKYPIFFAPINYTNIVPNFYQKINNKYYKIDLDNINNIPFTSDYINEEPYYSVGENTKYKITHPTINHPFELFGVPNENPWATINKFHVGPVRGYYDGSDVYLTTSAVMSFHTNLSPDYRIMFGSNDPAEICNKYRMRGYGIILNKNELAQIITYSENIPFWKNLYQVNKTNKKSIENFLSHKKLNDKLFRPRTVNSTYFTDSNAVSNIYNIIHTNYIENPTSLFTNLIENCKSNNQIINEIYFKLKFLKANGKPEPLKRWMIDMGWDLFEMNKIYT